MSELKITCPECGAVIPLDETLAGPLLAETRKSFDARLRAEQAHAEAHLAKALAAAQAQAQTETAQLTAKLAEAQKAQADFLRQSRDLADKQRELDLTVEKRVSEAAQAIQTRARAEAEGAQALKLAEREKIIADLKAQMEDMQRRAEQGSQQLQGEVLELQLEALLAQTFPADRIEPVAKGAIGADCLQHVIGPAGQVCGQIIWEMKRTKAWTDGWLAKLRSDQRAAQAEIAVILSYALPKGVESFALIDGVWVGHPRYAAPLAAILRQSLVDIAASKAAQAGQESKMDMVYAYLTGPRFRHRVEAIVEQFSAMRDDLNRERTAMTRLWAKREIQISAVIASTVGLHGDLQGIAGQAIGDIPALELPGPDRE